MDFGQRSKNDWKKDFWVETRLEEIAAAWKKNLSFGWVIWFRNEMNGKSCKKIIDGKLTPAKTEMVSRSLTSSKSTTTRRIGDVVNDDVVVNAVELVRRANQIQSSW